MYLARGLAPDPLRHPVLSSNQSVHQAALNIPALSRPLLRSGAATATPMGSIDQRGNLWKSPLNRPRSAAQISARIDRKQAVLKAIRGQRQRCPVCLGMLTHPARVGEPSRNFLAWNGTELLCAGGHGLLHIPEISTSWFSTQRWLYLDPSWESLFTQAELISSGA
jgi:hypothetical protein